MPVVGQYDLHLAELGVGKRRRNRLRARLSARIVTLDGTRSTVLLDLSLTGARIKARAELSAGQQAVLSWARFEAFGTLVWVENGMAGIVFDKPLEPVVLFATRDADDRESLPSDGELDRGCAREWVDGSRRL